MAGPNHDLCSCGPYFCDLFLAIFFGDLFCRSLIFAIVILDSCDLAGKPVFGERQRSGTMQPRWRTPASHKAEGARLGVGAAELLQVPYDSHSHFSGAGIRTKRIGFTCGLFCFSTISSGVTDAKESGGYVPGFAGHSDVVELCEHVYQFSVRCASLAE
jgi:hypothetical protein